MARKDIKGRNLRVGEYYDEKNQRYMFRKMVDGERVTITAANLADLRKQENDLLCKIDKGARFNTKKAKETLSILITGLRHLPRAGVKRQPAPTINPITIHILEKQ